MIDEDLARSCARWGIELEAAETEKALGADTTKGLQSAERATDQYNGNFTNKPKPSQAKKTRDSWRTCSSSLKSSHYNGMARDSRPQSVYDLRHILALGPEYYPQANELGPILESAGMTFRELFEMLGYRPHNYRKMRKAELEFIINHFEGMA